MPDTEIENRVRALSQSQLGRLAERLGLETQEQQRLVAYCEPATSDHASIDIRDLRTHLEQRLPNPQLPREIIVLDKLPRLHNGKIDHTTLARRPLKPEKVSPARPAGTPALTATESTLLRIWTEVLGTGAIRTDDNFFELGGDSISSIHVLAMAGKQGLEIPTHAIFDHPTIAGLAAIASPEQEPSAPQVTQLTQPTPLHHFPLNSVQKALYERNTTAPLGDPGVIQVECELAGNLDPQAFQQAWQILFDRHEGLRSYVAGQQDQNPRIAVAHHHQNAPTIRFQDISSLGERERESRLAEILEMDRDVSLGLGNCPVARFALTTVSPRSHRLLWTCHHALIDGWSASIVLDEFAPVYASVLAGKPDPLPPATSLTDYYNWLNSQDEIAEEWFWRNQLQNLDPTAGHLPIPAAGTAPEPPNFQTVSVSLRPQAIADLESAARASQSTPYLIFLASWAITLASYGNRSDIVFGTTQSGRSPACAGSDRLVALLANSLPFRIILDDRQTVADLIARLRKTQREILDFQHVDLSKIHHRWSSIPLGLPLFESLVVFANFLGRDTTDKNSQHGCPLTVESSRSGISSTFPATLTIVPGKTWKLNLVHDASKITPTTAAQILEKMRSVVSQIGISSDRAVATLRPAPSPLPSRETRARQTLGEPGQPHDQIESKILKIWNNAFGTTSICLDDDFVALGGHSLLSVVLITEIEVEFHCPLPAATILKSPTPKKLAAAVRLALAEGEAGISPPEAFIFIPGGFGDMLYFLELRRDEHQRLHVAGEIRAKKLHVDYGEHTPVSDVAARYANEIRKLQPAGSIYLASRFCAEFISLDVARHLASAGEPIAFLGIIDHAPPSPPAVSSQTAKRFTRKWLTMIRERRFDELSAYLRRTPAIVSKGLSTRFKSAFHHSTAPAENGDSGRFYYTEGFHHEFTARPFPGRVTVFLSSEFEASAIGKITVERWQEQALDGVEVVRIPGPRHPDIFSSPMSVHLEAVLNQTEQTPLP